jgi:plastocyanin
MTLETAPAVSPPRTRSWYRDVALFGVALILFFPIILAVGLTIGEEYDALIFPAIIAVVALAVGAVLLLLGRWWPIIGVIGGLAAAGSSLEFLAFSVEHIDSFFDFTTTIFPLVGGVILIVGSALTLWDERGNDVHSEAPAADAVVEMKQTEFAPEVIELPAGEIAVVVENDDPIVHTFTVEDLDVDEDLGAGDEKFIEFSAEPGEYELTCEVPGHESMDAIIRVR